MSIWTKFKDGLFRKQHPLHMASGIITITTLTYLLLEGLWRPNLIQAIAGTPRCAVPAGPPALYLFCALALSGIIMIVAQWLYNRAIDHHVTKAKAENKKGGF